MKTIEYYSKLILICISLLVPLCFAGCEEDIEDRRMKSKIRRTKTVMTKLKKVFLSHSETIILHQEIKGLY